MMAKILKPSTIIPAHLYVSRAADRQLDSIIEDMGRPGYVLVARQMGKTNLLINAKRRREARGDVVAYLDLTNRAATLSLLFRAIVDRILESLDVVQPTLMASIENLRQSEIEPSKEYDRSLRLILASNPSKRIVIVLDEIDSLVSVEYSDAVFAQIRSMYFSRVNHDEYNRLTYVLSGVAEPTDLIKDKNISPFNIGEKIYLEDFSQEELAAFVLGAGVKLSTEAIGWVYSWTSGNPRMSWDLCSELEDMILEGKQVLTKSDVADAVHKLFLNGYDRPPVDHIRVLTEGDVVIRNAISSIRWNKADTLDDRTRTRLYLAGITKNSAGTPVIKNRVIDAALSDSWLAEVSSRSDDPIQAAKSLWDQGMYPEVVAVLDAHREQTKEALPPLSALQLGVAKYFVGNFPAAAEELQLVVKANALEGDLTAIALHHLGAARLLLGRAADSLDSFLKASLYEGPLKASALLGVMSSYVALNPKAHAQDALAVFEKLRSELVEVSDDNERADIRDAGAYNAAICYWSAGRPSDASALIETAWNDARPPSLPAIAMLRASYAVSEGQRGDRSEEAVNAIVENHLTFSTSATIGLHFQKEMVLPLLNNLAATNRIEAISRLVGYLSNSVLAFQGRPLDFVLSVFLNKTNDVVSQHTTALWSATELYGAEATTESRVQAYRMLAMHSDRKLEARRLFIAAVSEELEGNKNVDESDLYVLITFVSELIGRQDYSRAASVLQVAEKVRVAIPSINQVFSILCKNQQMMVRKALDDVDGARQAAVELLELTHAPLDDSDPEIEYSVASMRRQAEQLSRLATVDPWRSFGRNDRVTVVDATTGQITTTKFKLVEASLRAGRHRLVR